MRVRACLDTRARLTESARRGCYPSGGRVVFEGREVSGTRPGEDMTADDWMEKHFLAAYAQEDLLDFVQKPLRDRKSTRLNSSH